MDEDEWISKYLLPKRILRQFEDFSAGEDQTLPALVKMLAQFSIEWFPEYFKKTYGIDIEFDESRTREFKTHLENYLGKILEAVKRVSELPEGGVCEAMEFLGKPFLELVTQNPNYRNNKYESLFDFYDDFYKRILFAEFGDTYLSKTKIKAYREAIYQLIDRMLSLSGGRVFLSSLLDSHEFSSDMFFMQKLWFGLITEIDYLDGKFKRLSAPTVYKLAELYYKLSEVYSKFVIVVRILVEFAEGNTNVNLQTEYNKHSLNNHVEKIRKSSDYYDLGNIDTVMRNALSHRTYQYDSGQKSIIFKDRRHSVTLKPKDLLEKTRELSSLVFALLNMLNYVQYRRLTMIRDYCLQRKLNSTN